MTRITKCGPDPAVMGALSCVENTVAVTGVDAVLAEHGGNIMAEIFTKEMWRTADGAEFTSKEAAVRHEVEVRLHQILNNRAAYGEIDVSTAVEIIIEEWSTLVTIMDELK